MGSTIARISIVFKIRGTPSDEGEKNRRGKRKHNEKSEQQKKMQFSPPTMMSNQQSTQNHSQPSNVMQPTLEIESWWCRLQQPFRLDDNGAEDTATATFLQRLLSPRANARAEQAATPPEAILTEPAEEAKDEEGHAQEETMRAEEDANSPPLCIVAADAIARSPTHFSSAS